MTTLTDTHVTRAFAPALRDTGLPATVFGQVSGIALIYDELDSYGTTFAPGSLDRTRREKVAANKVKLFWDHGDAHIQEGAYDTDLHIGTVRSLEDVTLPNGKTGAYMVADIFDTERGRAAKQYLEEVLSHGAETGLSIAFRPRAETRTKTGIRFDEVELREISITAMPSVPGTGVTGVRASSGACAAHLRDALALHDTLHPETGSMKPSVATHDQMTGMLTRALASLRPKKKVAGAQVPVAYDTVPGVGIVGMADTTSGGTLATAIAEGSIVAFEIVDEDLRGGWTDLSSREDAVPEEIVERCDAATAVLNETILPVTEEVVVTITESVDVPATIQLQVRDRPSLEAALDVLLRALPLEIVRAHVDPVLGNATTDDSDDKTGLTPSLTSNAEAEDSRAADLTAFATMEDRMRALRHSYAEAA